MGSRRLQGCVSGPRRMAMKLSCEPVPQVLRPFAPRCQGQTARDSWRGWPQVPSQRFAESTQALLRTHCAQPPVCGSQMVVGLHQRRLPWSGSGELTVSLTHPRADAGVVCARFGRAWRPGRLGTCRVRPLRGSLRKLAMPCLSPSWWSSPRDCLPSGSPHSRLRKARRWGWCDAPWHRLVRKVSGCLSRGYLRLRDLSRPWPRLLG